jgi:ribosomal protein L12E/L44/L45/RPP1/RPP2
MRVPARCVKIVDALVGVDLDERLEAGRELVADAA